MKTKVIILLTMILLLTSCAVEKSEISDVVDSSPTVLTLGSYGDNLPKAVRDFNEAQDEYRIEILDYSQNNTIDKVDAVSRLNSDLAKGAGPDLIWTARLNIDVAVYGQAGYFEDLYPYLDSDPDIGREDIVTSLLSACEVNGRLYNAVKAFEIITMFGKSSALEAYDEWNMSALNEMAETYGSAANLFTTEYGAIEYLYTALQNSGTDYMDIIAGTAKFENEQFKQLLQFCSKLNEDAVKNENMPPLSVYCISNFYEPQYYEALYGESIEFVGIPNVTGSSHVFVNISEEYVMNSASKNKNGAWSFIKTLLSEEYQTESIGSQFPSNVNALQEKAEYAMEPIMETDEEGNEFEQIRPGAQEGFDYYAALPEHVDQIIEMINNTEVIENAAVDWINLVMEDAQYYFEGLKSLEEVTALIQDRAEKYIAEKR